ncbi:MAG: hypothetical protein UX09_C0001G0013 [Candidatus Uhrbacteria bacterium GW2011_GWE2_45_35]|uniref:Uncharacterized protein n=2 Tax=Candidatus Uhriibacteriota TaxID=1752732 RepID=A0A0G1JKT0_9BACT|nr:MAG: hypothetical protein UW63_C0003G0005 [Candidatus Uhrbacteria bacterium GW2011_GWF2_44_350]KKU09219.1 MAG: hypothetical protein UX09_C0001G0013 [Candidatus Uhrbacteria bacterium GW2011_GWE2_45_35]HBR80498.1 hypothetical protein [Candidatus Uhrbacteria bacterium]HCU31517.1 hypothetical protein [Candidatus Uhrbacteria bacterium]
MKSQETFDNNREQLVFEEILKDPQRGDVFYDSRNKKYYVVLGRRPNEVLFVSTQTLNKNFNEMNPIQYKLTTEGFCTSFQDKKILNPRRGALREARLFISDQNATSYDSGSEIY